MFGGSVGKQSARPSMTRVSSAGAFEELLSDFNVAKAPQGPTTLGEMRKEERRKNTDPDKLKIEEWLEGKETNIRALLSTLPDVLWVGAAWTPVSFGELMDATRLRKVYQAACRLVHPDRNQETAQKDLANDIFVYLSAAHKHMQENG